MHFYRLTLFVFLLSVISPIQRLISGPRSGAKEQLPAPRVYAGARV